tara:strand:+ start:33 stop:971 length:939 start_codon:yes stop_codon:yes gene_type:complete
MSVRIYQAIKPDGKALWPAERPIEWLRKKRRNMPASLFDAQYMNDPSGITGIRYDVNFLQYYTDQTLPSLYSLVGIQAGDPATSVRSQGNYFGHCTAGKSLENGRVYILGFAFAKVPATKHISFLEAQYKTWKRRGLPINSILLEEAGPQQATTQHLAEQTRLSNSGPMPLEIWHPKGSKEERYDSMLPFFGNGTILFKGKQTPQGTLEISDDPGFTEFRREFSSFPKTGRDDLLDALFMVVSNFTDLAAAATARSDESTDEEWGYDPEKQEWTLQDWDKEKPEDIEIVPIDDARVRMGVQNNSLMSKGFFH